MNVRSHPADGIYSAPILTAKSEKKNQPDPDQRPTIQDNPTQINK